MTDRYAAAEIPVLVLNWNGWADSLACLRHLPAETEARTLWLVDNGSDDDLSSEIESAAPGTRSLRLNENFGWAGGYNRALKVAFEEGHEFAYLLNNDTLPQREFLNSVVAAACADDSLAAAGSCSAYDVEWLRFDGTEHEWGERRVHNEGKVVITREVSGAGMLIRLSDWNATPFDERYFCYHEEVAWCRTRRQAGRRVAMCLGSVVVHKTKSSNRNANSSYYIARNTFLLDEFLTPAVRRRRRARAALRLAWHTLLAELRPTDTQRRALAEGYRDGWIGHFGRRSSHTNIEPT